MFRTVMCILGLATLLAAAGVVGLVLARRGPTVRRGVDEVKAYVDRSPVFDARAERAPAPASEADAGEAAPVPEAAAAAGSPVRSAPSAAVPAAAAPPSLGSPLVPAIPPRTLPPRTVQARRGMKTHVVEPGETLFSIARAHYGDPSRWPWIAEANGIRDVRGLKTGQTLYIPAAPRAAASARAEPRPVRL